MMEIEKKFAAADLSSLKDAPIKLFAKACVQYQNYQTKKAFERFDYKITGWSESTATAVFDGVVAYLKYGSLNGLVTPKIKEAVDEIVASNRYIPLTPAKKDERKTFLRRKTKEQKSTIVPAVKTVVQSAIKVTQSFLYAVSSNNIFYTFKTINECNSFIQGVKFANKDADIKVQKISILED